MAHEDGSFKVGLSRGAIGSLPWLVKHSEPAIGLLQK
jgi:hypothetical protein